MNTQNETNGRPDDEMACRQIVEAITAYIEKTMPPSEARRFDAHLAECPYCVSYVEQMRQTIDALGSVDEEAISGPMREGLLEAFRGWKSR